MRKTLIGLATLLMAFMFLKADSCDTNSPPQTAATGAQQVTNFAKIPKNSRENTVEQQNIIDRLHVTTNPTKVLWIHLIALDGKIIRRMPVRAKVTSSEKRLEPRHFVPNGQSSSTPPSYGGYYTDEFIQPDGTFGSSDSYIYWFDPMGRYHQYGTAGGIGYLVTDYPIDLENPIDALTGLYNVQKQALEWQKQQEKVLAEKEGGR